MADITRTSRYPTDWRSRPTVTVDEAAAILGVGRTAGYEAARTGELPTLAIGRRLVVPVGRLRRLLGEVDQVDASAS